MAKGIAIGMTGSEDYSKMLMTYHPAGQQSSSTTFHNSPWLDFNMVQTGHDSSQKKPYEMIAPDYARTPVKPVVDSEAMYEKHSDGWTDPNRIVDAPLVCNYLYWGAFTSTMGHTYGHWYIWPFVDAQNRHPYSEIAKLRGDWKRDYLNDEVALQVQYLRKVMESRPWHTSVPDQSTVASPGSGTSRIVAIRGSDGAYLMVYVPQGQPFTADLSKLSGTAVKAYWFNPRTGVSTEVPRVRKGTAFSFTPPASGVGNDWVLVVDDAARNFSKP